MNRRRTVAVLLVAAVIALTGCGRGEPAPGGGGQPPRTIGLAVANLQSDFFNQIKQSVEADAAARGVEVIVADARGDAATQVNQIQDFVVRQVDAIIYIPAGATAASVPVRAAERANIPVVTVDRNPPDAPARSFIATDSVAAARTLGDWVVQQTGGQGRVGVIQGQIGTTPEIDRNRGFTEALSDAPGLQIVAEQASEQWAQDEGVDIASDMLQANPDLTVMFGRADALALGAAQAARQANRDPNSMLIVGFDGDIAGLEGIRAGTIDATMVQQTQLMGRLAVDTAVRAANGEPVPPQQLQEAFLLTAQNPGQADEYLRQHP